MNKAGRTLTTITLSIAGAILASAIILMLTPNKSLLAFIGWLIFFIAIQSPFFVESQSTQARCTGWLTRFQKRG